MPTWKLPATPATMEKRTRQSLQRHQSRQQTALKNNKIMAAQYDFGMIGLGVMGS